ncbi:MAG: hypothetical protein US68_C0010G0098 [Candidatus Shapirobacteria bacterium GW2011_GWE1_38_10]|uniref:PQ loop repeat protein n=1 Tax=Candidatus Shapirobacteria bacterium GW2011_GWE1_38_10 TaxID=1618488 RepID=A0A0G0KLA7_9BACT|nr:MAG: hypothetical protein US46_C0006G0153 [Candidatus Shapirobacteria bacterium GW2011_GWF2_37_20]KKQ49964.1 MAG: hypothetical protein US68_C0010G0098 [Candidatus Shapirobacteria bacterium GW2011_GWE1_38_10]KKQ63956.1 MAG: hypothetical protein US85_C0013G0030 [Candidatus Shapirobacteria bacterium GW2011_GWF1_38_23]HBP51493.1 hypothetical protein [Candidatus Shapirobacteria bacterium]
MKQILGIITVIMALVGYVPYLRDTFKGKTKPHVISWFLWTLVSFLAFGLQWSKGAGAGSYANFTMGLICLVLFIKSFQNGTKNIKVTDIISFVLAIIAIILWLIVHQPVWSIILVVIIDILSFIPTFIKSWEKPWQETLFTWLLSIARQGLIMLSLQSVNIVTILFPLYAFIANISFCTLLITRRRVIKADK